MFIEHIPNVLSSLWNDITSKLSIKSTQRKCLQAALYKKFSLIKHLFLFKHCFLVEVYTNGIFTSYFNEPCHNYCRGFSKCVSLVCNQKLWVVNSVNMMCGRA